MSVFTLVLYGVSLGLGAGLLILALRFRRKYRDEDFAPLAYFLAAFTISGFLNLFGRALAFALLHASTPESQTTINLMFGFLIFPFMLTAVYCFLLLMGALRGAAVPVKARRAFYAFSALVVLVLVYVTTRYSDTRQVGPAAGFFGAINAGILAVYVALSLWGYVGAAKVHDPRRRRLARRVSASYALFFGLSLAVPWAWIHRRLPGVRPLPMILFYFSSNVPALLAFRGYWRRRSVARPEPATEGRDPNAAFAGRGLTPRELEIVGLILQGQSNKDIERTLFISVHTVKNHLYKIYQKMGVRSRFQVVAMVRGDENSSPGNGPDQTG